MVKFNTNAPRNWAFVCLVLTASLIISALGDTGRELFAYQRGLFSSREIWRAISGHLTHLGWSHFLLNAFGLLGVWSLYGKTFNAVSWAFIFLICAIGITAGFAIFDENLQNYVGLSGVLHGLLAAGASHSLISTKRRDIDFPVESILVLAALGLKIAYEQFVGSVPLTGALSGGAVVVNAHLYGAMIGAIAAGGIHCIKNILSFNDD